MDLAMGRYKSRKQYTKYQLIDKWFDTVWEEYERQLEQNTKCN